MELSEFEKEKLLFSKHFISKDAYKRFKKLLPKWEYSVEYMWENVFDTSFFENFLENDINNIFFKKYSPRLTLTERLDTGVAYYFYNRKKIPYKEFGAAKEFFESVLCENGWMIFRLEEDDEVTVRKKVNGKNIYQKAPIKRTSDIYVSEKFGNILKEYLEEDFLSYLLHTVDEYFSFPKEYSYVEEILDAKLYNKE